MLRVHFELAMTRMYDAELHIRACLQGQGHYERMMVVYSAIALCDESYRLYQLRLINKGK